MRKSNRRKKVERPKQPEFVKKREAEPEKKRGTQKTESFSISWEPLYTIGKVSEKVRSALIDVYFAMQKKPADALEELQALLEENKEIPMLYDFIGVARGHAGQTKEAIAICQEIIEKFPDYFYSKLAQGEKALLEGNHKQIPTIFDQNFEFRGQVANRNTFHIQEALHFYYIMGRYFAMEKDKDRVEHYLEKLKKLDNKHFFCKVLEGDFNKVAKVGIFKRAINKIKRK